MNQLTYEEIKERLPGCSEAFLRANSCDAPRQIRGAIKRGPIAHFTVAPAVPLPVPEPLSGGALVSHTQAKSGIEGGAPVRPRIHFTLHRVSLLDPDNKWASVKFCLDAMRYAGLIPNDRECDIELIVTQTKVGKYELEGTGVEITYPKTP